MLRMLFWADLYTKSEAGHLNELSRLFIHVEWISHSVKNVCQQRSLLNFLLSSFFLLSSISTQTNLHTGACCIKCYELICSQESYKFGECYTFSTLKSVTFSKFVGFLATNQFATFYTTGPWSRFDPLRCLLLDEAKVLCLDGEEQLAPGILIDTWNW